MFFFYCVKAWRSYNPLIFNTLLQSYQMYCFLFDTFPLLPSFGHGQMALLIGAILEFYTFMNSIF